jgi:hypothetical protein
MPPAAENFVKGWRWESAKPVGSLNRWKLGDALPQEGAGFRKGAGTGIFEGGAAQARGMRRQHDEGAVLVPSGHADNQSGPRLITPNS